MKKFSKFIPVAIYALPMITMAATVQGILYSLRDIVNIIIPLLMAVAFAIFLWGVVKFIFAGGDENKRKEAKHYIVYGLIGLFVMVAVWGLIRVVTSTFGVQEGGTISIPFISP